MHYFFPGKNYVLFTVWKLSTIKQACTRIYWTSWKNAASVSTARFSSTDGVFWSYKNTIWLILHYKVLKFVQHSNWISSLQCFISLILLFRLCPLILPPPPSPLPLLFFSLDSCPLILPPSPLPFLEPLLAVKKGQGIEEYGKFLWR